MFAKVSQTASATLVTGVAGMKIRVTSYLIVASAAITFKFQSNTTDLTGAMSMVAGQPFMSGDSNELMGNKEGYFETAPGESLNSVQVGTGTVAGHLSYRLIP